MTTLYVAGPMTNYPEFNYPAFVAAAGWLYRLGYDVLSPTDSEHENTDSEKYGKSKNWYMRRALRMVTQADGIALLDGWENSEGVQQEIEVAQMLELDIRPLRDWLRT